MSAPDSLEAQMRAILDLHSLTHVSFSVHLVPEGSTASPFNCDMHHERSPAREHGVTFGYGDTLQAAYENAVSVLDAARAPKLEDAA